MLSGPSALSTIDQSLQTIRNDVVRLDSELQQLTNRQASQQRRRAQLLGDIAAIRLVALEQGELQHNLTAADQQAKEIMRAREVALEELNRSIDLTNQQIEQAELARGVQLDEVNRISQSLVDVEAQVQAALNKSEEYQDQLKRAQHADSVAHEAEQKVTQAKADMAEKAKPYQADPLFMYLWQRSFGTTEYSAGLLARFMDAWVARVISYEPARIDYWNLTEIPKRLGQHADLVRAAAQSEYDALQELEVAALSAANAPQIEADLLQAREAMDAHDDKIESLERALNELLQLRTSFDVGQDQYSQQCLTRLGQALAHEDLLLINRYVRETVSSADDKLLDEIKRVDRSLSDMSGDLADARLLHDRKLSKLGELEKVRRDFKSSRFDDVRSGFGNEKLVTTALRQFIDGLVSGADVWRVIKRHQRYRDVASSPDFGSGGFGQIGDMLADEILRQAGSRGRRRGSTWHLPSPRRGGGGFKFPSSGGSGDGGFTTGGGF
ncbi:hypothetical protein [Arenicella xantha]|uniref:Chromosome partition protein Smc n=1 Tax=Arenicella xantha TaxID=644221 RepID=A0A395JI27_9GAMM|nr:hypothetical protein [Arenicella xantha]RBP49239.1 hypothetical protein DFR28_104167 [Arenicella xantha]